MLSRICTVAAAALTAVGCAATGAVPAPFPVPGGHAPPVAAAPPPRLPSPAPSSIVSIVGTALGLRGVPYRNGGSDPNGFDCSGFVWYVFAQHGLALPRTVGELYAVGDRVDSDDLEPGDLVFFRTEGRTVSHVGVAVGGEEFVHAPNSRGEVRVERMGSSYWLSRYAGARRIR
jgi:cell wall-associated NlpC family hydrolase